MALFRYSGRSSVGALVNGELEADSENDVANHLLGNQITPVAIRPIASGTDWIKLIRNNFKRRNTQLVDIIFFSRQMYSLLHAGVPILDALHGLRDSTPNPTLAKVIGNVCESLDAGSELSTALRRHPEVFPTLYVNIIEIGETSGTLAESFLRLVDYLEQEHDTRSRIRAATRYPKLVLGVITVAIFVINLLVIPAFSNLFDHFHAQLPLPTRILIAISDFTVSYWYILIFALVTLFFAAKHYVNTVQGHLWWDRIKLRLPAIGSILYRAALGRFAEALAICINSGVPWDKSMAVVSQSMDNDYLSRKLRTMREGVERGETIALTASATGLFPPLVVQMIQVGEQTGLIDQQLKEVAHYYQREVDYQLKQLSSNIEPILLVVVGAMVLILALGIFMPMWGLASAVLHHH
jgi:MSHA biogenesis protein MshG